MHDVRYEKDFSNASQVTTSFPVAEATRYSRSLRQTANLNNFVCDKIKIINREMFELYDLLKESKMLHHDTLYDHRNVITDRQ